MRAVLLAVTVFAVLPGPGWQAAPTAPAQTPSTTSGQAPSGSVPSGQAPSPRSARSGSEGDAAYYFLLGRHLEDQGRIDAALNAMKQAIAAQPDSAELRAQLAAFYARQERAGDAVEAAREALERDPKNREGNRVLGSVYAALAEEHQPLKPGDDVSQYAAMAITSLERAHRDDIVDTGLEMMLGRLYVTTGAYDKAIAILDRVLVDQPGYSDAVWLLAYAHERAGHTDRAIATLASGPPSYRALKHLGELYEKQRQWKDAADAYAQAQAANPRSTDLAPRRAAALINAGQAAAARDLLMPLASQGTPSVAVLYLLAEAQRSLKDLDAAEKTALRLRDQAPEDVRGLYVLAQVLDDKNDTTGAERALRQIIERDPLDATALNYLGYMLAERGARLDEAVDLVQRALKVEPDNPSFLDSLGWAYFRQGHLDKADPALTEAATKLPENSVVQDHLGELRFRQQRYADAAAAWERSLSGDGDSIDRPTIEKKLRDARARAK